MRRHRTARTSPTIQRFATNEARVRNRDVLVPILEAAFATRPAAAWLAALGPRACRARPVRSIDEVFASPEGAADACSRWTTAARGTLRLVADPIRVDGERLPARRPPPRLGEHTDEVLRELDR